MYHNSLNTNLLSQIDNPMNGITQQPFTKTMPLSTLTGRYTKSLIGESNPPDKNNDEL